MEKGESSHCRFCGQLWGKGCLGSTAGFKENFCTAGQRTLASEVTLMPFSVAKHSTPSETLRSEPEDLPGPVPPQPSSSTQ